MKPTIETVEAAPAIDIKDLLVRFQRKTVLNGFSMQVFPGENVVLTGASGVGKSTVLRCILGFVVPDEGEIFIQGQQVSPESVWSLRTLLAYVPQEPELGRGTLEEWFKIPFSYRANVGLRKNLDRLPWLLERFSLSTDVLREEVGTLSGGEKQRAALVAAALLQRKIFLLDEPTSALDRKNGKKVLEFLFACQDALLPTVATMATIGLVALPGMMTGVILGGADPMTAIKYQIAIMVAIFTGTAATVILAILMSVKSSFSPYGILDSRAFGG